MRNSILVIGLVTATAVGGAAFATEGDGRSSSKILRLDGRDVTVDPNIPSYNPAPPLTGDLHIVGGLSRPPGSATAAGPSTTDALIELWIEIFKRAHPSVNVHKSLYASLNAAGALAEQSAQLGVAARELLPHETYIFRQKVQKPLGIPVASGTYDVQGVAPSQAVIVHKDNPVQKLTLAQLDAIFSKTRKRGYKEDITRWGQLGLTGEWADKEIRINSFTIPDGITYFIQLKVMKEGEWKDSLHQELKQDLVVQRVADDRYGIAFVNRPYVKPTVKMVPIGETDAGPFSVGSFEEVLKGTYPLSRVIYMYVNTYPDKPIDPLAKEFLRAVLSQEGQREAARTPFLPLSYRQVKEALQKIE